MNSNTTTLHLIHETKAIIQSFYNEHMIRIQKHFSKEYTTTATKLQNEPNIKYLQQILTNKSM